MTTYSNPEEPMPPEEPEGPVFVLRNNLVWTRKADEFHQNYMWYRNKYFLDLTWRQLLEVHGPIRDLPIGTPLILARDLVVNKHHIGGWEIKKITKPNDTSVMIELANLSEHILRDCDRIAIID